MSSLANVQKSIIAGMLSIPLLALAAPSMPEDPLYIAVHEAYSKLASYSRASTPLTIEVQDYRVISADSIGSKPLADFMTPLGEIIPVTTHGYQDLNSQTGEKIDSFGFDARWQSVTGGAFQIWDWLTMQQAIDMGAEMDPLETIETMAAFRVNVTLDGKTATYDTLAWIVLDKDGTETIKFLDQMFGPSVLATALTANQTNRSELSLAEWESSDPVPLACTSLTTYSNPQSLSWSSGDDHSGSGKHYASSTLKIKCVYSSNCSNQCTATASFGGGDTFWDTIVNLHYFADDIEQIGGYSGNGSTTTCRAGYGAGVRYCFLIPCGATVSLTLGSYGFSYSSSTNVTKRASINQLAGQCPKR